MSLTKQIVSISELFHAPKLTLRIKLVGYLRNNFGAMIRSNGTFFLNLHRTGYTVFLILRLIKLTRIQFMKILRAALVT